MNKKVLFSSKNNNWGTPLSFFEMLNSEFHFTIDIASSIENALCRRFYTEHDNALIQSWEGEIAWMNPPYGRILLPEFVKKASEETQKKETIVVGLIPARTDTLYWHNYIFDVAKEIRFLKGRLQFVDAEQGAPFPSAIIVWQDTQLGKSRKSSYSTITQTSNQISFNF